MFLLLPWRSNQQNFEICFKIDHLSSESLFILVGATKVVSSGVFHA